MEWRGEHREKRGENRAEVNGRRERRKEMDQRWGREGKKSLRGDDEYLQCTFEIPNEAL